jgi:hypothetical protein
MTTKIDGNNGVLQSYDYQVLTTGFSYTFASGITTLLIEPAGTLATGTITMPALPADGMVVTFSSTQQITALTVAANTGQSIKGNSVQAIPNQPLSWVYRLTNTTWYAMAGGAARATAVVSGTSVASTSGTSIDFTSIPSWVKRITVMFNGVSTSGSSNILVQLGDSGGVEATSYISISGYSGATNAAGAINATTGFVVNVGSAATTTFYGALTLFLQTGTTWIESHTFGITQGATLYSVHGGGNKSLSDVLDRVRITTVNGTDTFDAGSINILYE